MFSFSFLSLLCYSTDFLQLDSENFQPSFIFISSIGMRPHLSQRQPCIHGGASPKSGATLACMDLLGMPLEVAVVSC